jgi:hypothetical protein
MGSSVILVKMGLCQQNIWHLVHLSTEVCKKTQQLVICF